MDLVFEKVPQDAYSIYNGVKPSYIFRVTKYLSDKFRDMNSIEDFEYIDLSIIEFIFCHRFEYMIMVSSSTGSNLHKTLADKLGIYLDLDYDFNGNLTTDGVYIYNDEQIGILFSRDCTQVTIFSNKNETLNLITNKLN